jgi:hypothetical protein
MRGYVLVCLCTGLFIERGTALAQSPSIRVGPNVLVSGAHQKYSMGEVLVTADPEDPNRLLGCGIVYAESENRRWTAVYFSADRGQTWQSTLETQLFSDSADPACSLGRNGFALHATLGTTRTNAKDIKSFLGIYRSHDGGRTWSDQIDMPMSFHSLDRESVTIFTTGKYPNNSVYITGECEVPSMEGPGRNGLAVWRSSDLGITFEGPIKRASALNHYILEVGNSVVLSDGTLVSLFGDVKNYDGHDVPPDSSQVSNASLEVVTTNNIGSSMSEAVKVDDFFMGWRPDTISLGMPTLAVDSSGGPFSDRLYATWADERDGRSEIRLAYSPDKGKRWSKSSVIDDIPGPMVAKNGPENFLPTVAVNKNGVVAVTWYDRRENPDGLGWYLRVRASLDGGETWLPSVRVSQAPNTFSLPRRMFTVGAIQYGDVRRSFEASRNEAEGPNPLPEDANHKTETSQRNGATPAHVMVALQGRQFFAGDYAGFTADAGGLFHAFWIDNRTGSAQIWTATINVAGTAIPNGAAELAEFQDVSATVLPRVVSTAFDRASNMVFVGVELENLSANPVRGPIKLRLVGLASRLGNPTPIDADNQFRGPGAVWDFSPSLHNRVLLPGEVSSVRQLVFRVDHPQDLLDGRKVRTGLLDFDIRVLAPNDESQNN